MPAIQVESMAMTRCEWAVSSPLESQYHDAEWGRPVHDDRRLFELLILEGAQAGLSWSTILNKRDGDRRAFDNFDAHKIARYTDQRIERLMQDSGIVRNRLKITATISNAQCFLNIQQSHGGFATYLWAFVDGQPIQNNWRQQADVPVTTPISDALSKYLKSGFRFVGSTICYAYMQATGMANDHLVGCFCHAPAIAHQRLTRPKTVTAHGTHKFAAHP